MWFARTARRYPPTNRFQQFLRLWAPASPAVVVESWTQSGFVVDGRPPKAKAGLGRQPIFLATLTLRSRVESRPGDLACGPAMVTASAEELQRRLPWFE